MTNHPRLLCCASAGIFAAASLAFGFSGRTNLACADQPSRQTAVTALLPRTAGFADPGYDMAAGDGFLVSAAPSHLVAATSMTAQHEGTGFAETGEIRLIESGFSEGLTPAEEAADDPVLMAEGSNPAALPVDFTLAPATYCLAVNTRDLFGDDDPPALFDGVRTGYGVDVLEAGAKRVAAGFDPAPTMMPAKNLSDRLFATVIVP